MFNNKGFTITELSIAITFIAVLLLSIAMLTIQISGIYNKGLTLREVNEAGQLVARELRRDITGAGDSSNVRFVSFDDPANSGKQIGGRICTGTRVYAWNTRDYLAQSLPTYTPNTIQGSGSRNIRFMQFNGSTQDYCEPIPGGSITSYVQVKSDAVELLPNTNSNIVIGSLNVDGANGAAGFDAASGQKIIGVDVSVGTANVEVLSDGSAECTYRDSIDDQRCAINYFNFTIRSANQGGNE